MHLPLHLSFTNIAYGDLKSLTEVSLFLTFSDELKHISNTCSKQHYIWGIEALLKAIFAAPAPGMTSQELSMLHIS